MEQQKDVKQTLNASLNNCSSTRCIEDEREDKLQCCECKNTYHYQCTLLPAYQIQAYLSKRSKRYYYCQNCITVSPEVERLVNPLTKEQQEIKRLRRDIKRCENLIRVSEDNAKLTNEIIKEQLQKFDEKKLESVIEKKFSELEGSLKKIAKQCEKITYSDVLKETAQNEISTLIRVAKIEEKKEEKDHDQRQRNVIIHGTEETSGDDEEQKTADENFVRDLLKDISYKADPKYVGRIGVKREGRSRPLKVVFESDSQKQGLFGNLKALKGNEKYQSMSISDDYTYAERQVLKSWANQAKEKNNQEPKDSNIIWRVRGNPKSGLILKKFNKAPQSNQ